MEIPRNKLKAKALEVLEWPRLLNKLAERALSDRGKDACRTIHLATTVEGARRAIDETVELVELLSGEGSVPLGRFEDIREIVKRCEKGAVVKAEEFYQIASLLDLARLARGFFNNFSEQCPLLWERAQSIEQLGDLRIAINQTIDESGSIKENATPDLRRLLQSLRDLRASVVNKLEEFMRQEDISDFLQDTFITQRGTRYVLPVRAEVGHKIEGIVHDSSNSGQTLFIEPRHFIEANNRLKMAELEVDQEVERILKELVDMVAAAADRLRVNLEILTELDVIYARARLALNLDASAPELNDNGIINLKNVRHPHLVLQPAEVVPNDAVMDSDLRAIIISGPNTGGKTVMLKSIGLCALMVKAGMLIPADPGSEMALFTDVWADIGDEQNIEEHLSTFSGHIINIIGIINSARLGSLVLLDELVTSTDPAEGSALAEAILHKLVENGSKVITTTHYTQLKAYAEAHDDFENAGVEFDNVSMRPTYKFIQGLPGRSSALDIASRLGMDSIVVKRARGLLDTSDGRIEELLAALEKQREDVKAQQWELEKSHKLLSDLKDEQIDIRNKMRTLERGFRSGMRTRLAEETDNVREEIKGILSSLTKLRTRKAVKEARESLKDVDQRYRDIGPDEGEKIDPTRLKVGDSVVIAHLGVTGKLLEEAKNNNKVKVQIGNVPMVVPAESLRAALDSIEVIPLKKIQDWGAIHRNKNHDTEVESAPPSLSSRLDLRGFRTDDAINEVDRLPDRAALASISQVEIIHGHGTGTLKKFVREHLDNSIYVSSWKPGDRERGGDGVTIVNMKLET